MTRALLLLLVLAGCKELTPPADPDATPPAIDAGAEPDAPVAPPTPPSSVAVTAGGGTASSASHRLSLRIGAPQPIGRATSGTHTLTTGPGAIPWTAP